MYLINKTNIQDKIEISNPDVLHLTGRYAYFVTFSIPLNLIS